MRTLIIQLERLGDLIQTTPLIQDLQRVEPGASIDVLAWSEFASIIEGIPGITLKTIPSRRVHELNGDLETAPEAQRELSLPGYDRVINVSHGRFAAWLNARLEANQREGGVLSGKEWLYYGDWLTLFVALGGIPGENRFNIVDLYRACAGAGPPARDARAYVRCLGSLPFELPDGPFVAFAPGANEDRRRFFPASTVPLLSGIAALGFRLVFVGGLADQALARSIVETAKVPVTDLTGKTNVQQLAEVLRRADLVVSADSAPAHIAAALGRPLVGLYGACLAPLTTAPWGGGHLVLVHDRMEAFSAALVLAAVRVRLGLAADVELSRETRAAGVQAWRTAMLPRVADPLGGVTYLPLHTDRLDEAETLRRLMRHVMTSVIMGTGIGDLSRLSQPLSKIESCTLEILDEYETRLGALATDVAHGLEQMRERQFDNLAEMAGRVTEAVNRLKDGTSHPAIAPVVAFLDWKLRVMPAHDPVRIFQEYERELLRAAMAMRMAKQAAANL